MEASSLLSGSINSTYIGRQTRSPSSVLPLETSPPPYQYSSSVGLIGNGDQTRLAISGRQANRWASDFFIEEQPYWLEDLLNEPADAQMHRNHRRSASESHAYLGQAVQGLDIREDTNPKGEDSILYDPPIQIKYETTIGSQDENFKKNPNVAVPRFAGKPEKDDDSSQNKERSGEASTKSSGSKNPASKTDAKRAKQQSAHRSRVRKLQYITQLERTIQLLQVEGSEITAELEFVDHQNLILTMENKALRQRLESITQEKLLKEMEQDMLERELGRLQNLYQLQRQKQLQMHQQNPKQKLKKSP